MLRLHIIQPTHYAFPFQKKLFKSKKRQLVPLTLPYLAALIPEGFEIRITDEQAQDWDPDAPCDCVFISVHILNSLRAYEIADAYREKGIPVVIGGPHCTFYGDEVLGHADAIAVGEGETVVPGILEDLVKGRLQPRYQASELHDLRDLPLPRHDLLDPATFSRFPTVAVQTTRGCPYRCEFCAERYYLGEAYRLRPVGEVIEEIRHAGTRQIFFADSTFVANRARTMELMEALLPLRIRWSTLWNVHRVLDPELMELAKKSGLLHINMGVESIKPETLKGMRKVTTPAARLEEVTRILRRLDISFSVNLIFGWDTDRLEDFQRTLDFLRTNKVHVAFFNVFSPHKGTKIYDRYRAEGRLRDEPNMGRWPGVIAEIHPKHFTAEQLEEGIHRMYSDFYSWPSLLRRLPVPKSKASIASWFMNLSQRKKLREKGSRTDFDGL
jgi:radical SAM superfamily enzyme YgiQ (UPF0313 family)